MVRCFFVVLLSSFSDWRLSFSYHIHTFVNSRIQRDSGDSGAGMSGARPARRWKGNEEYESRINGCSINDDFLFIKNTQFTLFRRRLAWGSCRRSDDGCAYCDIYLCSVPVACPVFKRQEAGLGRERQIYTNTYYLDHCPDYCGRCFCTDVRTCQ